MHVGLMQYGHTGRYMGIGALVGDAHHIQPWPSLLITSYLYVQVVTHMAH